MTKEELIKMGFKEIPHFTITDSVIFDLGRNRHLSVGCIGTPNEMVFLCETDSDDSTIITDLICVHNYDYDGYIKRRKVASLVNIITGIDYC